MGKNRREALLKEYSEVTSTFRTLTDMRFRLLALLPIAAAAAAVLKKETPGPLELSLSLFGLVTTLGLITYNTRNDQLYDALVGRAAVIERYLGLPDGAFAHRPRSWLVIDLPRGGSWKVDHRMAIGVIYAASITLWLYGILGAILEFLRQFYVWLSLPTFTVSDPATGVGLVALALAVIATTCAQRRISAQRKSKANGLRLGAHRTVKRALEIGVHDCATDTEFLRLCAQIGGLDPEKAKARTHFYAQSLDDASRGHFMQQGPKELAAAHLVALVTDLPPEWLYDCYTNRRGEVPPEALQEDAV